MEDVDLGEEGSTESKETKHGTWNHCSDTTTDLRRRGWSAGCTGAGSGGGGSNDCDAGDIADGLGGAQGCRGVARDSDVGGGINPMMRLADV